MVRILELRVTTLSRRSMQGEGTGTRVPDNVVVTGNTKDECSLVLIRTSAECGPTEHVCSPPPPYSQTWLAVSSSA